MTALTAQIVPVKPGHKGNPIPIADRSEARANLSYVIVQDQKEASDGETVQGRRSANRREG